MVNRALSTRDPRVSYKVAWRPYALERDLTAFGSGARLEIGRDYQLVDLDEMLRKKENAPGWLFKRFAEDIVHRRLPPHGWYDCEIEQLFVRLADEQLAGLPLHAPGSSKRAPLLRLPEGLPADWQRYLKQLARTDPFDSEFAVVWLHQRRKPKTVFPACDEVTNEAKEPGISNLPWRRPWWRKERKEAIRFLIASQNQQRVRYAGWHSVLTVSGSSTIVLLHILREVWDLFIRQRAGESEKPRNISPELLSQAIRLVAARWLDHIARGPKGDTRKDFVVRLGSEFRRALIADPGLSYPGWTGFSLDEADYENDDKVRAFLDAAASFGDLVRLPHTSKERDGRPRTKFYLAPILCAHFEIPAIRTKEPYYARITEVRQWIQRAVPIRLRSVPSETPLFPEP